MADSPAEFSEGCVVGVEKECCADGCPAAQDKAGPSQQPDYSQIKERSWKATKYESYIEISKRNTAIVSVFAEQARGEQVTADSKVLAPWEV